MGELRTRIEAKKKQLEADLLNAKANAQGAASDAASAIKSRLAKLEELLSDGWDNVTDDVRERLNKWFHRDSSPPKGES